MKSRLTWSSMCVFVLLCAISLHANGSVIQYDDGHWEYQNPPLGGQAVYFTVPTEYGPAWNLETLSILTSGDPGAGKPVTVTVWEDNAGSMGSVLFQLESWVSRKLLALVRF